MAVSGVTLDQVRSALVEMAASADTTNAGAVRAFIGTGSASTIQKHLMALRSPPAHQVLPAMEPPTDKLLALWGSAVEVATSAFGVRVERLTVERDELAQGLKIANSDAAAALEAQDAAESERDALKAGMAVIVADRDSYRQLSEKNLEAQVELERMHRSEIERLMAEKNRASEQQSHGHELQLHELRSAVDRAGEREAALRCETARLQEQVGRLSAELEACRSR